MDFDFDKLKMRLSIGHLGLLAATFATFAVYYFSQEFVIVALVQVFMILINLFLVLLLWHLPFQRVVIFHPFYVFICSLVMIPNAFMLWHNASIAASLWFFVPPIAVYFITSGKTSFIYSLLCFAAYSITVLLEYNMSEMEIVKFSQKQLNFIDFVTIVAFFVIFVYSFFCIYCLERASRKEKMKSDEDKKREMNSLLVIYKDIVKAMEEKKLYINPDFTLAELADYLGTNPSYIYRALKMYAPDVNFPELINRYRIMDIKSKIDAGDEERYKMRTLYMNVGFRHQSTFNKTFKKHEGIPPKEYVAMVKARKKLKKTSK